MTSIPDVYLLLAEDGKPLPPAVQATVLAKYSRSPESARDMLLKISEAKAAEFQKKWFVTYGHSSVAELANFAICFEGVSIVASKFLESFQRGAYSEKSTRYQKFSRDSFVQPPGTPDVVKTFVNRFYDAYTDMMPSMIKICAEKMGLNPKDPEVLEKSTVKARAFDNLRYLLPAGTGTNVACVLNGRDVRYLVREALAHSNPEIRRIGELVISSMSECPVFIENAEPDPFEPRVHSLGPKKKTDQDWYVDFWKPHLMPDPSKVETTFEATVSCLYGMSWSSFCRHMETRRNRSVPKIFRTVNVAYEMMMDYGAYRDIQRHRRCEIYPELLSTDYGFSVPDDIVGTELENEYENVMRSVDAFSENEISFDKDLNQYVIPIGYNHRSLLKCDLEEVYYITELRTKPQGHISYRRVAYRMYEITNKRFPNLMKWCEAMDPVEIGEHK